MDEAEEAVGHEFNDADDYALGLAGLLEMGAGEAVITREAGCVAIVRDGNDRRRFEVEIAPLEPISSVGSGDCFLAGYVAARYEDARPPSAWPTASPAAPSPPSTLAPGASTRTRSSGSCPGSRSGSWTSRPGSAERAPGARRGQQG